MREHNVFNKKKLVANVICGLLIVILSIIVFSVSFSITNRYVATSNEMQNLGNIGRSMYSKLDTEELQALNSDSSDVLTLKVNNKIWGKIFVSENIIRYDYESFDRSVLCTFCSLIIIILLISIINSLRQMILISLLKKI